MSNPVSAPDPDASGLEPHSVYEDRWRTRRGLALLLAARERRLSNARLVVFVMTIGFAVAAWVSQVLSPIWTLVPAAGFIGLIIASDAAKRRRADVDLRAAFYAAGLDRLRGAWMGKGDGGDRYLRDDHPYARDLDLFGAGGLFERIGIARTRAGQATLAEWLLEPASVTEARARQVAVAELRGSLDLREDLAILGERVRSGIDPEALSEWGAAPTRRGTSWLRLSLAGLTVLNLVGLGAWILRGDPRGFLLAATISAGVALFLRGRVRAILEGLDEKADEFRLLAGLLERLESEAFHAPWLLETRRAMESAGEQPSRRIARLARLVGLLQLKRNQIFAPLALLFFWSTQLALAIEDWRGRSGKSVEKWLKAVGRFEAVCALASYAFERPSDTFPELETIGPLFIAVGIGHPLIPDALRVGNDVSLGAPDSPRVLMVSGSNMSGKSTLLRSIGVNAVLAQAGGPVCARSLQLSPLTIGATLRVQDSLQEGRSRFFAEIVRLRQVVGLSGGEPPLLFLLDEILHGTNSNDRRAGAEAVVRGLARRGAIGLVTTHDLALAETVDRLGVPAINVHFEDHLEGDKMTFDYVMRPGVVTKSNALALMRAVGLEV